MLTPTTDLHSPSSVQAADLAQPTVQDWAPSHPAVAHFQGLCFNKIEHLRDVFNRQIKSNNPRLSVLHKRLDALVASVKLVERDDLFEDNTLALTDISSKTLRQIADITLKRKYSLGEQSHYLVILTHLNGLSHALQGLKEGELA